jgi:hypothetical protein
MVDPRISIVFNIEVPDYRADPTPPEKGKRKKTG